MKKPDLKKSVAIATTLATVVGYTPTPIFAINDTDLIKDGTYQASKQVYRTDEDDEEENEWPEYVANVSVKVQDGKFAEITATPSGTAENAYDVGNDAYFTKAYSNKKGIQTKLVGQAATVANVEAWDSVSGATRTSKALKEATISAITTVTLDTTELQKAIDAVAALKATDYTTDSWNALQTKLTDANNALSQKTSQEAIDRATAALNKAIKDLVKDEATYIYGTVNLTYADFYYGELNKVTESSKIDLTAKDKVSAAGYRDDGVYDAVTSATTSANKSKGGFVQTYYDVIKDADDKEVGVNINGLKDVNIAVPKSLYEAAKKAIANNDKCSNKLLDIVGAMELSTATPAEYKVLNGDGTLGAMVSKTVVDNDAKAVLATRTSYGQYQINITFGEAGAPKVDDLEGAVIETSDGKKYGMEHLENLWRSTGQIAFTVAEFTTHGNKVDYKRTEDLQGKTVTKITYLLKDKEDVVVNTNIYVKNLVDSNYGVRANDTVFTDGAKVKITKTMPTDSNYKLKTVAFGRTTLEEGTDYTVSGDEITFKDTDKTAIGTYTITYSDDKYEDLKASFVLTSAYQTGDLKLKDNTLVLPEGLDVATYLNSISTIRVNGTALSGRNIAKTIFNTDGTVNLDATTGSGDSAKKVFGEAGTAYQLSVSAIGYPELSGTVNTPEEDGYKYVYAGLTWAEYWASEGVYLADGSALTSTSTDLDAKGESDKGAFDTVSRATTNHGLHRGSYQCEAVIYDTNGKTYEVASWNSSSEAVLRDGSTITFSKGIITLSDGTTATMDHYEVKGIKYVPVKVKAEDYDAFVKAYDVVENNGILNGGYGEQQLKAYALNALVTNDTNGLKTATKNKDGSFSFGKRKTGTDSGIRATDQAKATNITSTVKPADGSYGEFLRVDLTGADYGDLGSKMYAVRWDYYGTDSTYTKSIGSYGTKFAADNWMHKSMGIQLGLTDSLRCQLPKGTDGTGYWTLTVYAMGYEDYTVKFEATDANIVKPAVDEIDTTKLQAIIEKAEGLNEKDYTVSSWANMQTELAEAKEELNAKHSQAAVNEAIAHLTNAINELSKVTKVDTTTLKATIEKVEELKESDYTTKSWQALTVALSNAKAALKAQESQSAIDEATSTLQRAIDGLEKVPTVTEKPTTGGTTDSTQTTPSATVKPTTTNTDKVKTGDTQVVGGLLAIAFSSLLGLIYTVKGRTKKD